MGNGIALRAAAKPALPTERETTAARCRGYNDARKGLPFAREYDGWRELVQINYELGRQQAACAHRELGGEARDVSRSKAPLWRRNAHLGRVLRRHLSDDALQRMADDAGVHSITDMTYRAYARWFTPL